MSARGGNRGGCLGCAAVLALLAGCVIAMVYLLAPTTVGITAQAYTRRTLESLGVEKREHLPQEALGYLGQRLSEREQQAYMQILEGVMKYETSIAVLDATSEEVEHAYSAMMCDHPELFWLDGSFMYTTPEMLDTVTVEPGLGLPLNEVEPTRKSIEAEADAVLAQIGDETNEYEVAQGVYTYIASTTTYAIDAPHSQTIQSVLLNHQSVCAGYARTYQYLLQRAGMFCAYVEGTIASTGETHAWNLTRIGGEYTYVDPTWADPTYTGNEVDEVPPVPEDAVIYDYLGLTTGEMERDDHVFKDASAWPVCEATDFDYYRVHGLYFDAYDEAAIGDAFWRQVDAGGNFAAFKFGSEELYNQVLADLSNGKFQRENLLALGSQSETGETSIHYSYSSSDALHIIKLYW
ncbi:MAG: hypothetical protein IKG21_04570 [Atopobiaceae bacterium]|nr:hypothetical protein [Atopobiaceae bacterium]